MTPPKPEPTASAPLCRHPATPSRTIGAIEVGLGWREARWLALSYVLKGDVAAVDLPAARPSQFADRLWEHTCFEAFLADAQGGYYELNFSPSTQWAVYRFSGYRKDMTRVRLTRPPEIRVHADDRQAEIHALIDLGDIASVHHAAGLRLALSAVIEETDGTVSYWALAHPSVKPDFHHPDAFTLELPQPVWHEEGAQ